MDANSIPHILVVDDERSICNVIVDALASEGLKVYATSDPVEALQHIARHPVDLVLSDLVMGEHSGVEVLEKTLETHQDAVVIIMTAHPTVQTAISILKAGAFDFLVKPFKLDLLRATIRRGLDHLQVVRENLRLRAQVEFLRVAGSTGASGGIDEMLRQVASSCRKETDAQAVGIIEIDPENRRPVSEIYGAPDEKWRDKVLDHRTIDAFAYTKSPRPRISSKTVHSCDESLTQVFISQPVFNRRVLYGVINLLIETQFNNVTPGQLDALNILATSAASGLANHHLYQDIKDSYLSAIRAMANAIEARDTCTAGHTDRVCQLAQLIGEELGWSEKQLAALIMGCTLHDIGKIGVPDRILNKPEGLTDEEQSQMRAHPEVGLMMIDGIDLFKPAIPYIISHHEWYDGTGYPNGLAGDDIPIEGRLLALADTVDAIMSDRPYRDGAGLDIAVGEVLKYSGSQFDPDLVEVFIRLILKGTVDFEAMYGRHEDLEKVRQLLATSQSIETAPV